MKKIIKVTVFAVTIFSLLSCSSKIKKQNQREILKHQEYFKLNNSLKIENQKKELSLKKYIDSLSLEEKISQLFLINLEKDDEFLPVEWFDKSTTLPDGKIKIERKTLIPSGYIFFGYNISKNPSQIISFTNSVVNHAVEQNLIPPFLSIDVEGGFVNRLRGVAGPLPENERISEILTPLQSYNLYSFYAKQLFALGFNLNLAPVAEICTNANKDFLSGRSYGSEIQAIEYATKSINAYQNSNVGCVVKHFPGNTNIDPHIGLPKIDMSQQEFDQIVKVFSEVIKSNPSGVLMSHAIVPNFDKHPACLSKFWVTDVLRNKIGYDGIIFSDDIFMGALINNGYSPKVASKLAILAGVNCIMISEKKFGRWMELLIEACKEDDSLIFRIDESVFKILKYKLRHNIIQAEFDKISNSYLIKAKPVYKIDDSLLNKRRIIFDQNKLKSENIYKKYFYNSASNEEKKGLFVE